MWSTLKVFWRVAVNLAVVAIVLAMFRVASSPFDTVLLCAVTLAYMAVQTQTTLLARMVLTNTMAQDTQFLEIAKLLNHPDIQAYTENLDEARETVKKLNTTIVVNGIFSFVLWLLVIWKLVEAVGLI